MEVEPNVALLLRKFKDEYKNTHVRTHADSFGNVYDMRNINEKEEHALFKYLFKNPSLCCIEVTDPESLSNPFIDVDANFDWQKFTTISRRSKLQSVVLCDVIVDDEGNYNVNINKVHIIFLKCKLPQAKIHAKFIKGGVNVDPSCKISMRLFGQYKRDGDEIIRRKYLPCLAFFFGHAKDKLFWHKIVINKELAASDNPSFLFECENQTPWKDMEKNFPDIDEDVMMDNYAFLKSLSIRNSTKNNGERITQPIFGDREATLRKLEDVQDVRFLCGAYCDQQPFDYIRLWNSLMNIFDERGGLSNMNKEEKEMIVVDFLNMHLCFVAKGPGGAVIVYRGYDMVYETTTFCYIAKENLSKLVGNLWNLPFSKFNRSKPGEPLSKAALKELENENNILEIWYHSMFRKSFIESQFMPAFGPLCPRELVRNHHKSILNTYTGLAFTLQNMKTSFEYKPHREWAAKLNEYIYKRICNSNLHLFGYICQFINFCLKYPEKNLQTMLYINGGQGTGKSLFTNLISKIFGKHAYILNTFADVLSGGFNAHITEAVLCICDEFQIPQNGSNTFKSIITSEVNDMKKKFETNKQIPNHTKYLGTGNKTIDEIASVMKSNESFTRRVVSVDIDSDFNRLTDKKTVEEAVQFMFKPTELTNESNPKFGIRAWTYGFFDDENKLFEKRVLDRWDGGRFIPSVSTVTVASVENLDENVLLKYLAYKFGNKDYCLNGNDLKNPLIEAYWPDRKYWGEYPERISKPLENAKFSDHFTKIPKLDKIFDSHLNAHFDRLDHYTLSYTPNTFQQIVCLDLILQEIQDLVKSQFLVENQKTLTIQNIRAFFKPFSPKKHTFTIPIPLVVIERMESAMNGGVVYPIATTEARDYAIKAKTKPKDEKKYTFLDIGDLEKFKKTLVQQRKVLSEDLVNEEVKNDDAVMERIYGKKNIEDFLYYFQRRIIDTPDTPMANDEPSDVVMTDVEDIFNVESPNLLDM